MFGRKKNSNWEMLKNRGFGETAATRDVHGQQEFERGDQETISNPTPRRILAFVLAILSGIASLALAYIGRVVWMYYRALASGQSVVGLEIDHTVILDDWRIWAFTAFMTFLIGLILYERLMAGWRSENSMADSTDINPHTNDQFVMLTEEAQETLDWFPDTGAHSSVQVSSMISHVMLSNKGLKKVRVPKRYDSTTVVDGVEYHKGEVVRNNKGDVAMESLPLIDEEFGQDLLTASAIPIGREAKEVRRPYDVRKIPYNPPVEGDERKENPQRVDREKLDYDGVVDLINEDWEIPAYEVQRPAGAYLVDTAPVNTMVLAITRGGKGKLAPII